VSARVVVGIDGSPEAETALHFAADEAAQRGLPLRIVCAWEAPAGTYVGEAFAPTADGFAEAERHADDVLRAALEHLAGGAPIETEALAIEGQPAKVLIEQSEDAALLVVGSRGRGAAAGLLLGSVSQKLAQHASCPLAIVPCAKR
jgi:nucleotide-binding universal stress UspA family protein